MKITSYTIADPVPGAAQTAAGTVPYRFTFETAGFGCAAQITAFCYVKEDAAPGRPVLFATNGGPGSSVAWLHLGLLGPRRLKLENPVAPSAVPPFELEDNPHCLLDLCDLVLMDPPGAGFSDEPDYEKEKDLCSVDGDAAAVALFMEEWLIRHGRVNDPIYFAGESYGTIRAPALCDALFGGPFSGGRKLAALSLSGIFFLGTAFTTTASILTQPQCEESVRNLLSAAATTAYHHPDRFPSPEAAAEEAWNFAPRYLAALFAGRALPEEERKAAAETLSRLTCLPADKLLQDGLRYTMKDYRAAVLPGQEVGAYDGRYVMDGLAVPGSLPMPGMTDPIADDPAMGRYCPAFCGGMGELRKLLSLPEKNYSLINFTVNSSWQYASSRTAVASLENAMRRNPSMRLFFGSGLYDLVTVAGNVRYTLNQSRLPLDRVTVKEYRSGHMPYLGEETASQLEADIRAFIR